MSSDAPLLVPLSDAARRHRLPAGWLLDEALAGRLPHLIADGRVLFVEPDLGDILVARARATVAGGAGEFDLNESPAAGGLP